MLFKIVEIIHVIYQFRLYLNCSKRKKDSRKKTDTKCLIFWKEPLKNYDEICFVISYIYSYTYIENLSLIIQTF